MINDIRRTQIIHELNRMKLELDTCYDYLRELEEEKNIENNEYLERNGSIRGKRNHVQNILRNLRNRKSETPGVIVYLTSCGIIRQAFDNCKMTIQLLDSHRIKYRVEDLNIDIECGELLERKLGISKNSIFENLPIIFVNNKFLGTYKTLIELNDKRQLANILRRFQSIKFEMCELCQNRGYIICPNCHGSHRSSNNLRDLRCSNCDINGIIGCPNCKKDRNRNGKCG
ncbi:unnamed protein product [Caenorhabditis angaria]|uniref:Glutaredoxin domain-containing protein n=1 Tax=Caenorhabditis angaria TaxID=860376 RepID=A0A9P1IGP8_9PELO|nr:unnamed protein product [Caenorhabditis angaria]